MVYEIPYWLVGTLGATYLILSFALAVIAAGFVIHAFGSEGYISLKDRIKIGFERFVIFGIVVVFTAFGWFTIEPAVRRAAVATGLNRETAEGRLADEIARRLAEVTAPTPVPYPSPPTPADYLDSGVTALERTPTFEDAIHAEAQGKPPIPGVNFDVPGDDRVVGHFPQAAVRVYPGETILVGENRYRVCDLGEESYFFNRLIKVPEPEPTPTTPTPPAPSDAEGKST